MWECADLADMCDAWCSTSHKNVFTKTVKTLLLLNIYQFCDTQIEL